jgi:hypothetical protein
MYFLYAPFPVVIQKEQIGPCTNPIKQLKGEAIDENHDKNNASEAQHFKSHLEESDGGSLDIKGQDY